jgi:hypothetical protein
MGGAPLPLLPGGTLIVAGMAGRALPGGPLLPL